MNYCKTCNRCTGRCCNGAFDPYSRCRNIFRRRVVWVPSTIIEIDTAGF